MEIPGDIFGGGQGARDTAITYDSGPDLEGKVTDFRDTGFQATATFMVYNNTGLIGPPVGDVTASSKDPAISISGLPLAGVAGGSTSATVTISGLSSGRNTVVFTVNSGGAGDVDRLTWINP